MKVDTVPVWQGLVSPGGRVFCVPVKGQKIVLPAKTNTKLIGNNEFTLDPNRLTVAESPWGGLKGTARDYAPGTVSTATSGVYLTDTGGANTSKILTAGKLKELNLLTVDKAAKTITEEFIIKNSSTSNAPTVVDKCDTLAGDWSMLYGTATFSIESGFLKVDGVANGNSFVAKKTVSLNLASSSFITFDVKGSIAGGIMYCWVASANGSVVWNRPGVTVGTNTTRFVLPLDAPAGTTAGYPFTRGTGFDKSAVTAVYIGISGGITTGSAYTLYIDNIATDVGKWALVEVAVPDAVPHQRLVINSSDNIIFYTHDGSSYTIFGTYDTQTRLLLSNNGTFLDSSKLKDVYGAVNTWSCPGAASYYIGLRGAGMNIMSGTTGSYPSGNYSNNYGTKKRYGVAFLMPPSDNGRTSFNQVRLKLVTYYDSLDGHSGAASYEFNKSSNASYGLLNLAAPWVALLDSSGRVECYVFTDRPNGITARRDDSGNIYELEIDPGNSLVYRFVTWLGDQTTDTDADLIPNAIEGALFDIMKGFEFNKDLRLQTDLSTSAITANDFSIDAASLDIIPFAAAAGNDVFSPQATRLTPAETVVTSAGNVSIYDVRGLPLAQVRGSPGNVGGDCKVFDTVTAGNTTESTWIQVFSTDWVFTGDCVVENGLIRIKKSSGNIGIYYYSGSYVSYGSLGIRSSAYAYPTSSIINVTVVSNDVIIGTITTNYSASVPKVTIFKLYKSGGFLYLWYPALVQPDMYGMSSAKFAYDGTLTDCRITPASKDHNALFIAHLSTSLQFIHCYISPKNRSVRSAYNNESYYEFGDLGVVADNTFAAIGAIPFDCSQLYKEGEAMTGGTYYTGADAYPGTGNTGRYIDTNYGSIQKTITAGTNLPIGTYTVYFRLKMENAVTTDYELIVKDTTDNIYISRQYAGIPSTTFAFYSIAFTLTPAMVGHSVGIYLHQSGATVAGKRAYFDYILIVPTGLIEKYAKRALWNPAPGTQTYIEVPR